MSLQRMGLPFGIIARAIQSPPTSFISQIYLVSGLEVAALDSFGKLINKKLMDLMAISAPVMSADRVFINGGDGLYSYSLDLSVTKNSEVQGGISSPAVGPDGTVYVIDRNKTLWAFVGQRGFSTRPNFQKPSKGRVQGY